MERSKRSLDVHLKASSKPFGVQVGLGERSDRPPGAQNGRLEAALGANLAEFTFCSFSSPWSCGTPWQNIKVDINTVV